jgi:predicted DNA-binding transcriptional regulator YafY
MDYRKENGERKSYLIEPYSLRITADDNVILYAVKLSSAEIRSFRTDRIINATVTDQTFAPRYTIDFIPAGPAGASARPAAMPISKAPRKTTGAGGPRYVFRCPVCDKQFTRSTNDATLKAHKDKQGTPCYGRYGVYVTTNY